MYEIIKLSILKPRLNKIIEIILYGVIKFIYLFTYLYNEMMGSGGYDSICSNGTYLKQKDSIN